MCVFFSMPPPAAAYYRRLVSLRRLARPFSAMADAHAHAPVRLTKDYIRTACRHLEETEDVAFRDQFWTKYVVDNVTWEITGQGHELAGVRHSLAEHSAASFTKLGKKLTKPIKFVVRSIILEPDSRQASIEYKGYATQINGKPYNNDYVWLTQWNEEGKITSVRSYHDTHLAEEVLHATA